MEDDEDDETTDNETGDAEDWGFYPCQVDDAPGSIFLDLALVRRLETLTEDTLYAIRIQMVGADSHGMGGDEEAELLFAVEDAVNDELAVLGIRYLGRLRNGGAWQLTYMGPPTLLERVEQIAERHLTPARRQFSTYSKSDPEWEYYAEFLYPSDERLRWIQDRRVVDALEQHGDPLTERRRVDHWCYFPDARAQSSFAAQVVAHRFEVLEPLDGEPSFPVQVHRVDSVQLEDIHEVTGWLTDLAERCGGEYDGWETSVEATTN